MRSESEGGAYIGAEVIDNNLSFFESIFIFFYRLVFKPLIHETNKCIYTTHTNGGFLIAQLLYRFGVPFSAFCPNLSPVILVVFIFFLIVLALVNIVFTASFTQGKDREKTTGC